jgi:hypothetical protein
MLQRSPTYIASRPARDPLADRLRAAPKLAYAIVRWKNTLQEWRSSSSRHRPST